MMSLLIPGIKPALTLASGVQIKLPSPPPCFSPILKISRRGARPAGVTNPGFQPGGKYHLMIPSEDFHEYRGKVYKWKVWRDLADAFQTPGMVMGLYPWPGWLDVVPQGGY